MTDTDTPITDDNSEDNAAGMTMQRMPLFVHSQYIKDLSFENPKAPEAFQPDQEQPVMDISFTMNARGLPDNSGDPARDRFEVVLGTEIKALRGDDVIFLIELQYGAVVSLRDVPEKQKHPMLLIEVPRFLFPYIRQLVSELTTQAGYAPLLLTPVNFKALYMKQFGRQGRQGGASGGQATNKTAKA